MNDAKWSAQHYNITSWTQEEHIWFDVNEGLLERHHETRETHWRHISDTQPACQGELSWPGWRHALHERFKGREWLWKIATDIITRILYGYYYSQFFAVFPTVQTGKKVSHGYRQKIRRHLSAYVEQLQINHMLISTNYISMCETQESYVQCVGRIFPTTFLGTPHLASRHTGRDALYSQAPFCRRRWKTTGVSRLVLLEVSLKIWGSDYSFHAAAAAAAANAEAEPYKNNVGQSEKNALHR